MTEHLIKTLTLDIQFEKTQRSQVKGEEVASLVQSKLLPELEAAFDRLSSENVLIELPHFEIDLGTLQADSLETGLQRWMAEQLPKEMERLAQAASQSPNPAPRQAWLFYFLQNGYLPWSAPRLSPVELEDAMLENFEPEIWQWVLHSRPANLVAVVERLVMGRSPQFRSRLVEVVFKGRVNWQEIVFKYLKINELNEVGAVVSLLSTALVVAGETDEGFEQKVLEVADTYLSSSGVESRAFEPAPAMELFRREWKRRFKSEPPGNVSSDSLRPFFLEKKGKTSDWMAKAVAFFKAKQAEAILPASVPAELNDIESEGGAIYVPYAGQVLFAPFLPTLFERLSWQKQGVFKSEKANLAAVQAVGYLATGRKILTEHELLLGKIICGWPIEQPVPGRLRLSKKQAEECEAMLQAIIRHWGAIGNASPAGLREGYFEREGKLSHSELGWVLRVEQRSGLDLLLDRLPWGISKIKLPWMQGILMVEWT